MEVSALSAKFAREDALFNLSARTAAFAVLALFLGVFFFLVVGAWPALREFGFGFFTESTWDPVKNQYGALSPITGTLLTSAIALLIAVPISFGIAVFLTELCPASLKGSFGTMIELLASIPSIIYGLWGLLIFAPLYAEHVQAHLGGWAKSLGPLGVLFQGAPIGIGISTAGIILSFMVIPFIASVMRDVFETVPPILKESAYALGATRWEVVRNVVLPYTKVGVFGGIMLGLGRALGETMAVTFVIGNAYNISPSLFEAGNSIASSIANEFAEAGEGLHVASLTALGLILFLITTFVLIVARLMLSRMQKKTGGI